MSTNSFFRVGDLEFINGGATLYKLTATSDGIATFSSPSVGVELMGIKNPTTSTSAVNKAYVDNLAAGLKWKLSVRLATTIFGVMSTAFIQGSTIDGLSLVSGDRILIKNNNTVDDGIYIVNITGSPTRSPDLDTTDSAKSISVFVEEGAVNADTGWVCTNDTDFDTPGTDRLSFAQFAGAGSGAAAGDGITVTTRVVAVDATVVRTSDIQTITGVKTFSDNISLSNGFSQTAGSTSISGGLMKFNDNIPIEIGSDSDLVLVHDGTDSNITSTSGDLIISNTLTTGSTIIRSGTDTNQTDIQFQNSSALPMIVISGDSTITTISKITLTNTTPSNSKDTGCLVLDGGLGVELDIYTGGNSHAFAHISTSDIRKKKDIKSINTSIDLIYKLNPVSYKWKKEGLHEIKYGLIAQEVQKLLPDAVHEDTKGFLSLDYNCIWTLLLKSHQELIESHQELIESHQELIESHQKLNTRVTKLEDLVKKK
jgi:hypothetical protein